MYFILINTMTLEVQDRHTDLGPVSPNLHGLKSVDLSLKLTDWSRRDHVLIADTKF